MLPSDPTNVAPDALLLLCVQVGRVQLVTPGAPDLVPRLRRLVERARHAGALVVHVQHDGARGTPDEPLTKRWLLHPDFRVEHGDLLLRKSVPDALDDRTLAGERLLHELAAHGVRGLTLAGLYSESDVAATARTAARLGFRVTLAGDAHASPLRGEWERTNRELAQIIDVRPVDATFPADPATELP